MPRATGLLAGLSLGLVTVVVIGMEVLRQIACINYGDAGCRQSGFDGLGNVVAVCAAIGAVSAFVGGTGGRRIALVIAGAGLVVTALWSLAMQWCCREFLPQPVTMTGLFLVATIVLWRRVWPRWGLIFMATVMLAITAPYVARMVDTGHRITQPLPTAQPGPEPIQTPSAPANGQG